MIDDEINIYFSDKSDGVPIVYDRINPPCVAMGLPLAVLWVSCAGLVHSRRVLTRLTALCTSALRWPSRSLHWSNKELC